MSKKYIYEISYIDTRGKLVETEVIAEDESEAWDVAANEDYYFSSRGYDCNMIGEHIKNNNDD